MARALGHLAPLLLIPCLFAFFETFYSPSPLGALLFFVTSCYICITLLIALVQLIYGMILVKKKQPRAGLHLGSSIALGVLLAVGLLVSMQIPSMI